jgi:tetratricopeptide (TPR) repeat protein
MSIKNIKERLEGSYRLIRIKKIKRVFFAIEMMLALFLGLTMAFLMGATFDPLYFPVDVFSFIILIMLLVISIETIYFNGLELKYTKNKSRKFLLARNAIRRSTVIIAVSGFCVLALMLPYTQEKIADMHSPSSNGKILVPIGYPCRNESFQVQDSMGLTRASSIQIKLDNNQCQVVLVLNSNETNSNFWQSTSPLSYSYNASLDVSKPFAQNSIYIIVDNQAAPNISFTYSVASEVSPFVKVYMPAMGLAFIIVQFAAISIMYPIRENYASSSIYSKNYVAETDSGEYSVSEIRLTKKEKEEEAILDKALDLELPLPEPVKPKPKPQAQKEIEEEMARFKGKVDDGLIEEPDVKCSSCGEMNSAQSAMCFSCGTALKAAEKIAIDPIAYIKKGESFANAGRYDDAISCYDEALKHDGGSEAALLKKGEALHRLGKWGSAVQYVNTALKVNPNNVETLVLKAKILEERDRFDKSIEIYSQILALDPNNAFAKSKMEKVGEHVVMITAEDVLEQFMCVPGIGLARATALYEAGFTSLEMLKGTSEEKLAEVKGISKGVAKKIKKGLEP